MEIERYESVDGREYLEIVPDPEPEDPREWDNLGRMVCFHNRYVLGDAHDLRTEDFESWDDLEDHLRREGAKVILPLYLLDHSGLRISTEPFNDPWDSGQIGFIYATGIVENEQKTKEILRAEVEEYDRYLRGEAYGFTRYRIEGHSLIETESCFGFSTIDHALEANGDKKWVRSDETEYVVEMDERVRSEMEKLIPKFGEAEANRIVNVALALQEEWGKEEAMAEIKLGLYSPVPPFKTFVEDAIELRENRAEFERLLRRREPR